MKIFFTGVLVKGHNWGQCKKCGKFHKHPKGTLGKHIGKKAFFINCSYCGGRFKIFPSGLNNGQKDKKKNIFCSWICKINWQKENLKGKNNPFYGKHHTFENIQKDRNINLGKHYSKEINKKKSMPGKLNPFYGKHHTEEFKKYKSEIQKPIMKEKWKNSSYVQKMMKSRNTHPNKMEKFLDKIINNICPNFWLFSGDGKQGITVDGHIPDWINLENKMVIELFGDYWHNTGSNPKININRTAEKTTEHYNQNSYKCLIVWDTEVKDSLENVMKKIKKYTEDK